MLQTNQIQEKYYNLDQIQYTIVLISVSNKIHINTLYILHIVNIYKIHTK